MKASGKVIFQFIVSIYLYSKIFCLSRGVYYGIFRNHVRFHYDTFVLPTLINSFILISLKSLV